MSNEEPLRQALIAQLGRFPERVAPAISLGAITDCGDYTRTLISYDVEPDERISAWLLRPMSRSDAKLPGILAIHQHAGEYDLGKSEPAGLSANAMYHYGHDLCQRGYVVLCPDQLCFEDRRPSEEQRAKNGVLQDGQYERFEFTRRIATGTCLQTKYLHDLVCALSLLAGLPEVDETRLGAIGHSLGGQEALWLAWYDPRVRAAVSSCGFGLIHTILRDVINHNFALYIPGMLELCDTDTLVAGIAPRAFMLTAGEYDDIFPIDGVRQIVEHAKAAYQNAGVSERFQSIIFPAGHSLPDEIKTEVYQFLDHWLENDKG